MAKKFFLAGLAGGVALFAWSIVAWPLRQASVRVLPDEERVVAALKESGTPRGLYLVPGYRPAPGADAGEAAEAQKGWEEKARQGPLALVVFEPEGRSPSRMFQPLTRALAVCVFAGMLSAWILSRARVRSYTGRAGLVVCCGILAWAMGPATEWIWFRYPTGYVLRTLLDGVLGWTIVGAVQAGILKGQAPGTPDVTRT